MGWEYDIGLGIWIVGMGWGIGKHPLSLILGVLEDLEIF